MKSLEEIRKTPGLRVAALGADGGHGYIWRAGLECVLCEFKYVCEFCSNENRENCGKSEDEIAPGDDG